MKKIGQILVDKHIITEDSVLRAYNLSVEKGMRIGEVLMEMDVLSEEDLYRELSYQFAMEFIPKQVISILNSLKKYHTPCSNKTYLSQ